MKRAPVAMPAALCCAVVLACGGAGGATDDGGGLPSVIDGGGRSLVVDLEASHPVRLSVAFSCGGDEEGEGAVETDGHVELEAGEHFRTFDVSGGCWYGIVEVGMPEPPVGATLSWTVAIDGLTWDEDRMTLEEPLRPGYGFFLQTGWEDAALDDVIQWRRDDP